MNFENLIERAKQKSMSSLEWFKQTKTGRVCFRILLVLGLASLSVTTQACTQQKMPMTPTAEAIFKQLEAKNLDWKWSKVGTTTIPNNILSELQQILNPSSNFTFRATTNPLFDGEKHVFAPLVLNLVSETKNNSINPSVVFFSVSDAKSGNITAIIKLDPTKSEISAYPPEVFEKGSELYNLNVKIRQGKNTPETLGSQPIDLSFPLETNPTNHTLNVGNRTSAIFTEK